MKNSDRYTISVEIIDNTLQRKVCDIKYNTNYLDEMQSTLRGIELKVLKEYGEKLNAENKKIYNRE